MPETLRSSANQKSIHLSIVIHGRQALSQGGAMVSNEGRNKAGPDRSHSPTGVNGQTYTLSFLCSLPSLLSGCGPESGAAIVLSPAL